MGLLKNKKFYLFIGCLCLFLAGAVFYSNSRSQWSISIRGLHTLGEREVKGYVLYYLKNHPENVSSSEIEEILKFHPRVKTAKVTVFLKNISIVLTERKSGYLWQQGTDISEVSENGEVLQDVVTKKGHLLEDMPIFYLTAENDNEIKAVKSDIIRLWEKTRGSYSFVWDRVSEFVLLKDEMGDPEIEIYHSFVPVKIVFSGKMDVEDFRKLWALFSLVESGVESGKIHKNTTIRVYQNHAVMG